MTPSSAFDHIDKNDGCLNSKISDFGGFEQYDELQRSGRDIHNTLRFLHLRTTGWYLIRVFTAYSSRALQNYIVT